MVRYIVYEIHWAARIRIKYFKCLGKLLRSVFGGREIPFAIACGAKREVDCTGKEVVQREVDCTGKEVVLKGVTCTGKETGLREVSTEYRNFPS